MHFSAYLYNMKYYYIGDNKILYLIDFIPCHTIVAGYYGFP